MGEGRLCPTGSLRRQKELGKKGVHFDLAGEHVYALTDVPTPRLGGLRSKWRSLPSTQFDDRISL